jgi:cytoskeletal protein CcmA (bactofilin family)
MSSIDKNFIVKQGLEVAEDLIFADGDINRVGINTREPLYDLQVSGDIALENKLLIKDDSGFTVSRVGILSQIAPTFITGIDTTGLRPNDIVTSEGTFIFSNTRIADIQFNIVELNKVYNTGIPNTNLVYENINFNFTRDFDSGNEGDALISRGANQSPVWARQFNDIKTSDLDEIYYPTFAEGIGRTDLYVNKNNLVFNPGRSRLGIAITNPKTTLDVNGDVSIASSLTVDGFTLINSGLNVFENVRFEAELRVQGQSLFEGNVDINANVYIDKELEVNGNSTFYDNVEVQGETTLNDTLEVDGATTLNDTLEVDGATELNSTLRVQGETNLNDTLEVDGATNLNDTLEVDGATNLNDTLEVDGATNLNDTLEVDGATNLNDTLEVDGATELNSTLRVQGETNLNDTLEVDGATELNSTLRVQGETNLNDTLEVDGATNLNDTLEVDGATELNSTLRVEGQTDINDNLNVALDVSAQNYFGIGDNLVGIVTQIVPSIGINISSTQEPGKGIVTIDAYTPAGKTIFVNQNGNDDNSGLTENDAKRTIKSAASISLFGDTIKVFPGTYVEDNPIVLNPTVSVEGAELRNCVVTPKNPSKDLFLVNNGCHITDISFIGQESRDGASIVALQPLLGVESDRYFDAARMLRYNLDFIAAEAVGYLTSTDYQNPPFELEGSDYSSCKDDVKDVFKAVIHDITRGGNSRCVGAGLSYYSDETLQHIVGVKTETIDTFQFAVGIAFSCINNVLWQGNYQNEESQLRDLAMQPDPLTGSNTDINSCSNVLSAVQTCVGIVTTIIDQGPSAGIVTTFPGNSGIGFTTLNAVTNAVYDEFTGKVTITSPDYPAKVGDIVEIRDLEFECSSNGSPIIQKFPSGKFGYEFYIERINEDDSFDVYVGISTIPHTYISETGFLVNRSIKVTDAVYDNLTGITTITAPGAFVRENDFVILRDLEFSCPSGPAILKYPSGKEGFSFKVNEVIGTGTTFVVTVGTSTLPHTYESGGLVFPSYSRGVGPITQGPYIRNCTNFVPNSIGMKVDGFAAEPGDQDDIGVTGTMSVDSYTQFNQGGIGVSITNGAYSQLVSIFTICNDTAIFTASGGQCDLTNSNSSFGTFGLVSDGVGDAESKSIYRYTGEVAAEAQQEQPVIAVGGIGTYRPYDGQALYFGELYFTVQRFEVTNGGSGYTQPPNVIIDAPTGPNGIRAEAIATIQNGSVVAVDIISTGNQYLFPPNVQFAGGGGEGAEATAIIAPIYYTLESATLPSAGISTITLNRNLNNTVSIGTTVYFSRLSLQITSSHSFEWVGSGNNIFQAKPALGGVVVTENEVVKNDGGEIIYTSTDQAGNFRIGDGIVINQLTGTISGRAFSQSILSTVTPLIVAVG